MDNNSMHVLCGVILMWIYLSKKEKVVSKKSKYNIKIVNRDLKEKVCYQFPFIREPMSSYKPIYIKEYSSKMVAEKWLTLMSEIAYNHV